MKKTPLIFYGWFIVGAGMISYTLGYGARYSFSVMFPTLLEEFRWPRDVTAAMLSFHFLFYGLMSPVAGHLADRIGPRKTMVFGTMILALGLVLAGKGDQLWHFYLGYGVLTGAGLCLMGAVPFTSVIRNWFEIKRGLAFSLLFFGAGGAYACYPAVAFLINRFGWRNTFLVEAAVVAGIMLPIIIFIIRYHPREKGLKADGALTALNVQGKADAENHAVVDQAWISIDWTLSRAFKTRRFWVLCLSTFTLWGVAQHILVTHHVAFAIDTGYSRIYASAVLSLFGVMFAFGSLAAFISDRIGRESTYTIGCMIAISGIMILILTRDTSRPWMLYYYAVTSGFGLGMTSPIIPATITDIFQGPKVGVIIGFIWFCFAVGGTIGPWLGGWLFELKGNYIFAYVMAIVLVASSCAAIWLASPRKVRQVAGRVRSG